MAEQACVVTPMTGDDYRVPVAGYAVRITVGGQVQGVGYRPFVYRLAKQHGITGQVQNRTGRVEIIACGRPAAIRRFRRELIQKAPPLAIPEIVSHEAIDRVPFERFSIVASEPGRDAHVHVPPDFFMCDDCRRELEDPANRRYGYPFINCTQCGPRYTLIGKLPYDRPNTSMARFDLCAECEREYLDPSDRRFHAEPLACADCGPALEFSGAAGDGDAIAAAAAAIAAGRIVAVKGIGGYHLVCDAANASAVERLRQRKARPAKPFAVMFPAIGADGLEEVRRSVTLTDAEAELVSGPMRPIVLATKKPGAPLAEAVAPGLGEIGVFLPYSPLHSLLLGRFGGPVVATSGNLSGEPVLTDNGEAGLRLSKIADDFLHHDRPIVRPADDPVYRRIDEAMRPIRIGRGSAPKELAVPWRLETPTLAVGGHLKATVTLAWRDRMVVSPHIGDMDSPRSLAVFGQVAEDLQALYGVRAERLVCDAHPGYATHRWCREQAGLPVETVWHHHAHASALAAETGLPGRWLVFAWDGVGLGEDGALWGGEALYGRPGKWRRVSSLVPFRLTGGDRAGREPWRSAAALAWHSGIDWRGCPDRGGLARQAWERNVNCFETSAAGRLFDAAAAFVTGITHASHEAEGPMRLEALCRRPAEPVELPLAACDDGVSRTDWSPLLAMLLDEGIAPRTRAEIFHSSLAFAVLEQARRLRAERIVDWIGLTGGVFQNRVLAEEAVELLERDGFSVFLPTELPANDAGLSFGQAAEVAARDARSHP